MTAPLPNRCRFAQSRWNAPLALVASLLTILPFGTRAEAFTTAQIRDHRQGLTVPVVDGQVVVRLAAGVPRNQAADLADALGFKVHRVIDAHTYLIEVPPAPELAANLRHRGFAYRSDLDRVVNAAAALRADGRVRFAEPNAIMKGQGFSPNDQYYEDQWHLFETDLEEAWAIEWGEAEVKVAVLDTGLRWGIWAWIAFQNWIAYPWDFIDNDDEPDDMNGHGTHTAGIIGVRSNNYSGLAGMAPETTIMPIRILDEAGIGSLDGLLSGLDWAIQHGADVVNMSLSFPPGYDPGQTLLDKIQEAHAAGLVLVGSTGNDGVGVISYPAVYNEVISVGGLDKFGGRAVYSNAGAGLDVMAPGGMPEDEDGDGVVDGILSISFDAEDPDRPLGYWYAAGTSQAAPQVAALAALLKSHGVTDNETIASLIKSGCRYIDGTTADCATGSAWDVDDNVSVDRTSCWNTETGYGLIDPHATLSELVTLGTGVDTTLGGHVADYESLPTVYPAELLGAVLDLPEGLLLILEDDEGLYAFIDDRCDSRDFVTETEDDSTFESVCDIAQYELQGWTLDDLLSQDGGLIQFIQNNGGLVGFLNGNGALLGSIANNGGLLGMLTNNGGLLGLLANNGGILGLLDSNGAVLGMIDGNGGLVGFLNNNGGLLGVMTSNGGLIGHMAQNGGLLGYLANNGQLVAMADVNGTRVNGLHQSDLSVREDIPAEFDEE
ncbi:MAG: hypothetical protein CME06_05110 [Gemmatimonadetes bacterium]|nr:hypothetical protein [Gemmatimonadota bacterium]